MECFTICFLSHLPGRGSLTQSELLLLRSPPLDVSWYFSQPLPVGTPIVPLCTATPRLIYGRQLDLQNPSSSPLCMTPARDPESLQSSFLCIAAGSSPRTPPVVTPRNIVAAGAVDREFLCIYRVRERPLGPALHSFWFSFGSLGLWDALLGCLGDALGPLQDTLGSMLACQGIMLGRLPWQADVPAKQSTNYSSGATFHMRWGSG